MTRAKVREVFTLYIEMFRRNQPSVQPVRNTAASGPYNEACHILWMCYQAQTSTNCQKDFRWLGFVQGWLWARSYYTIDELKQHNKPEGVG